MQESHYYHHDVHVPVQCHGLLQLSFRPHPPSQGHMRKADSSRAHNYATTSQVIRMINAHHHPMRVGRKVVLVD